MTRSIVTNCPTCEPERNPEVYKIGGLISQAPGADMITGVNKLLYPIANARVMGRQQRELFLASLASLAPLSECRKPCEICN